MMKKSALFLLFASGCVAILLEGPPASALPYDAYPWCAQYSGDGGRRRKLRFPHYSAM